MKITLLRGLVALGLAALPVAASAATGASAPSTWNSRAWNSRSELGDPTPLLSPLLSSVVRAPFDCDTVEIKTKDKLKIKASWYAPRKKSRPVPGVVLIHDAGADRSSMDVIAERLRKEGFAVIAMDLRGHGDSKTETLDWAKLNENERKAQWAFAQRDVDATVDWILSQDNVHSTRLALVGHGAGCALAVRHMRDDVNAVAVALIEPRPTSFGFNVHKDLVDLEGLPTYVVAPRDDELESTEAMVKEANSLAGGNPFVELWLTRPPVLEDRKTAKKVAAFLELHAMPKKGR